MNNNQYNFWEGNFITRLKPNEVFVFGSNPEGRYGAGAAKVTIRFGAQYGQGRGLMGQSYGLVTKNLKKGFTEPQTGITYHKYGEQSVSLEQISNNIDELYECARNNPDIKFYITYKAEFDNNNQLKKSLNGYDGQQMFEAFTSNKDVPENIYFHDSFKHFLDNTLEQKETSSFEFFFTSQSPFSQWHPSVFTFKDITFISAEQFMMYSKARTFNDLEIADKILDINDNDLAQEFINKDITAFSIVNNKTTNQQWNALQKEIKKLGRQVKNYKDEHWVNKRESVVKIATREKYSQNPHLMNILLDTNSRRMVEASPYDRIWGIGLKATDPRAQDPKQWKGLNLLGSILTQYKEYLLNNKKKMKIK